MELHLFLAGILVNGIEARVVADVDARIGPVSAAQPILPNRNLAFGFGAGRVMVRIGVLSAGPTRRILILTGGRNSDAGLVAGLSSDAYGE